MVKPTGYDPPDGDYGDPMKISNDNRHPPDWEVTVLILGFFVACLLLAGLIAGTNLAIHWIDGYWAAQG